MRFRAKIDGQYHPETYAALREHAALVEKLSGNRQLEELEKMLLGPHPERALEDLWELQILVRFLPELAACKGIAQPADYHNEGDVWDHTLQCTQHFREEDDSDVRLAALFHDAGKVQTFALTRSASSGQDPRIRFDHHATVSSEMAENALARLQCPKKRREKISWLIKHHMMMGTFGEMNDERKAHWYFHPWFTDLLRVFWLDIAGTDPADFTLYESIVQDYQHFLDAHPAPPKPLVSGEEVMQMLGIQPGAKVGEILKTVHDAQIRGDVTTKKEAKEYIERLKKTARIP